jgi:formylglycine-generating enzyme required for sulfatase activity/predicted Ser/Thr protein kinase
MTDSIPEKLGKYWIIEEEGRGGFAVVYKAVDTTLDRTVALKVLAPHLLWDPTFVQRFQREARVAANLDHPNIVTIYEVSQIEEVYFIAMQFLRGRTLSQILEAEGPLSVPWVQAIIEQIASALDYAHARGFIHRDIKPSNVIVADDGRATLTDFGLAKAGEGTQLTTAGTIFGSLEYMSPEQAQGKEVDERSDVYSLGITLFEMLVGRVPYKADLAIAVVIKHLTAPLPRPSEWNPIIPEPVERVILKALAKNPADRFQSAGEMAQALTAAAETKAEPEVERGKKPAVVKKPEPVRPFRHAPPHGIMPEVMPSTVMERLQPFEPEMILIPAGEFLMGSDPTKDKYAEEREQPQYTLYLPDYYLAKTPLTNTQYAAFVQATGYEQPELWKGGKPPRGKEDHPVVNVSWNDAAAYCAWLSEVTGKSYFLPSEAEWEKGARGSDGRIYPWGNQWDAERCNSKAGGQGVTTPVGAYPQGASPYGLLDMAGNVWEWTRSLQGQTQWEPGFEHPYNLEDGWDNLKDSDFVVLRGGAFNGSRRLVRCAYRLRYLPLRFYWNIGFRVVVPPSSPLAPSTSL